MAFAWGQACHGENPVDLPLLEKGLPREASSVSIGNSHDGLAQLSGRKSIRLVSTMSRMWIIGRIIGKELRGGTLGHVGQALL